jgi:hypothetical protein
LFDLYMSLLSRRILMHKVDLPRTMREQIKEWRIHNDRRMDKL